MTSIPCIGLWFCDTFLIAIINEYGKKKIQEHALLYKVAEVCKEVIERRCVWAALGH